MDASGFWGANASNKILYHKEPTRSSDFIKKSIWANLENINPNILLCHAREASPGYGFPLDNKNNHPFVNQDLSIGLIHNGKIPSSIYKKLRSKYKTISNCDSEIILRIFQSAEHSEVIGLEGIKNIWSLIYDAHMSVAIGQIINNKKNLWLFRNEFRPNYYVDMRASLGQIFFISTPEIWQKSIKDENIDFSIKEIPPKEIWFLQLDSDISISKFEIQVEGIEEWEQGDCLNFDRPNINKEIYTNLNENEDCPSANFTLYECEHLCSNIMINIDHIENNVKNGYKNIENIINKLKEADKIVSDLSKLLK